MALVMGISSAQAILLKVRDDCMDSSGVYAIRIHLLSKCKKAADELGSLFYKRLLKTIIIKWDREDTPPAL